MAAPARSASAQRGSGGSSRADPITPTVTDCSSGNELIAAHPLLRRQGDHGAAQDALGVLAARVDRERAADPGLAAGLVDVPVQAGEDRRRLQQQEHRSDRDVHAKGVHDQGVPHGHLADQAGRVAGEVVVLRSGRPWCGNRNHAIHFLRARPAGAGSGGEVGDGRASLAEPMRCLSSPATRWLSSENLNRSARYSTRDTSVARSSWSNVVPRTWRADVPGGSWRSPASSSLAWTTSIVLTARPICTP